MDETAAEQDIRGVIEGVIEALRSADARRLDSLLSDRPGCLHIGSDPIEWYSKAQILGGINESMSVGNDQVRAEAGAMDVHVVGDVAWAEGRGRFVSSQGAARPFRMTWVFARDDGQWKSVQSHTSIGIPNQEMFAA
jgi:ketosteroid isomerase-like protein